MTSQPDKLFRDKLEGFQRPAPAGAWDKIESNLSKPNRKFLWIKIAAGILLLAVGSILLWPAEQNVEPVATTKTLPIEINITPQPKKDSEVPVVPNQDNVNHTKRVTQNNKVLLVPQEKINKEPDPVIPPRVDEPEVLLAQESKAEEQPASVLIVYSAEEVNAKFLKKKNPTEATPESKEASGIQKLIGLAYTVKNSDTGLAGLRQKKDEILALNFSEKKGEN